MLAIPLWAVMAIAVAGIALALAALQVFVRDVEHVLMPVLMMLMYLTPILYPLSLVPGAPARLGRREPVHLARRSPARGAARGRSRPRRATRVALAVALALFVAGRWMFRRLSPHFEDFV